MPKSAERKVASRGGSLRYRMAHPEGRPDLNIPVTVTKKAGPRGGKTVAMVTEPKKRKGSWKKPYEESGSCPGAFPHEFGGGHDRAHRKGKI